MLKNIPTDIILKIQSFLLGEPHLYRIKRNPILKTIQDKYKVLFGEPDVWNNLYINQTQMSYLMIRENIKPHMINNLKNLNRIVNFINHYQYGIPEDYDDETEGTFNLDDDAYDEIDIDDENPIKVVIELTIVGKEKSLFRGEIFKYNQHHTKKYLLEKPTKKLVSKSLGMFFEECQRFERRIEDNELLQFHFTHFEVQVFIKHDEDSDSEED